MNANQSAKNYEINESIFLEKITWLKTFLTISIVYLHCSNYTVYHLSSESIGFSRIVYELNKTVDKYKSRFKSLLIPYLAWNILSGNSRGFLKK